jgi:hypothetical protein
MLKTLALILLSSVCCLPAAFAASKPEFQSKLSSLTINQDESVEYHLQTQWPRAEGSYAFSLPVLPLKNLVLERQGESQETYRVDGQDWTRKSFVAVLRPLEKGEGRVEDFILPYVNTLSQDKGELLITTPSLKIMPAPFKINPAWSLAAGAGLLLPTAGILLLRKRKSEALKKASLRTPQEHAVEEILFQLRAEDFNRKDLKEKLHQLSSRFRTFLPVIYGLKTPRPSDREILEELKTQELPAEERNFLERILKKLDEAKFMGQSLSESDFMALKKEIETFVEGKRFSNSSLSSSPA